MLQIMIACRRTGLAFAFVRERTLGSLISCKLGYKLPPCTTRSGQLSCALPDLRRPRAKVRAIRCWHQIGSARSENGAFGRQHARQV